MSFCPILGTIRRVKHRKLPPIKEILIGGHGGGHSGNIHHQIKSFVLKNKCVGEKLLRKSLLGMYARKKYRLEIPYIDTEWMKPKEKIHPIRWQLEDDDPYPWVTAQFASVVLTTTLHTEKSSLFDNQQKLQLLVFVDEVAQRYSSPSSKYWKLARFSSSVGLDGFGVSSLIAGFAHTNDFSPALQRAEDVSGAWLHPLPWYASYAPIEGVIVGNYVPNLAWEIGGTANLFTAGIGLQGLLPTIYWEKNRQYKNYLLKNKREEFVRIFDIFQNKRVTQEYNSRLIMDHSMGEVNQLVLPEYRYIVNRYKTEAFHL